MSKFVKMIHNRNKEHTIEVPVNSRGRMEIDNKGFVHLRKEYRQQTVLNADIIKKQFHSETVHRMIGGHDGSDSTLG